MKNFSLISPAPPFDDATFKISFEDYLALSDEERDSIHTSAYSEYRNWIGAELERRGAEWMLVVGGEVIASGETLDEHPSRERLYQIGYDCSLISFVFVANPVIEESFDSKSQPKRRRL